MPAAAAAARATSLTLSYHTLPYLPLTPTLPTPISLYPTYPQPLPSPTSPSQLCTLLPEQSPADPCT